MAIEWFFLGCLVRDGYAQRGANTRIWVHQDEPLVPPSLLMAAHCQTNLRTSHGSHTTGRWKWRSLRDAVLLLGGDPTMDTAPLGCHGFQDDNRSFSLPLLLLVLQSSVIPAAVLR